MLAFIIIQVYTIFCQKKNVTVGNRNNHGAFTII